MWKPRFSCVTRTAESSEVVQSFAQVAVANYVRYRLEQLKYADDARYGVFVVQLTITAVQGPGLGTTKLFLFERVLANPLTETTKDVCKGVCSIPDIAEYPEDAPDPTRTYQFFRKEVAIFKTRSTAEAQEAVAIIASELLALTQAADNLEELELVGEIWVPSDP